MSKSPIRMLCPQFADVQPMVRALSDHPELWNQHRARLAQYAHSAIDDIWVRYNDIRNFADDLALFNRPHTAVWYPAASLLPVKPLVFAVMSAVEGERLGGVLITRVPPGGQVKPHIDYGWHARYYDKYAIQIAGTREQAFCFSGVRLHPLAGDLYAFDNSRTHWVENPSQDFRITLIICIRTARTGLVPVGNLAP
jgi:hypothetical protein